MARDTSLVVGSFDDDERLLAACRAARDSGIAIHDTYVPFAVHGLDEAMGLRRTRLTIACFVLGLTGLVVALGSQLWATVTDWPVNIGGKSHSAIPALIPITFELTILFAAIGTVLVFFFRTKLWPGKEITPLDAGATNDRFLLVLEAAGEEAADLLREQGAADVRAVEDSR
jgi:hypothetical protein